MTMDEKTRRCAAALMARSNFGLDLPDKEDVTDVLNRKGTDDYTISLWMEEFLAPYIEGDEHYDAFLAEAEGWYALFDDETLIESYPKVKELVGEV